MRIGIDARIIKDGYSGGVQQVIMGLASGLSQYTTDDDFIFIVYEGAAWLEPYMQGNCHLHTVAKPSIKDRVINRLRMMRFQLEIALNPHSSLSNYPISKSDGTIENLGIDVMHFLLQGRAFLTDVPSIYHPWDLQHLHLPHLFTPYTIALRERIYRAHCEASDIISVGSQWIKDDIIEKYKLAPEKVKVVYMASLIETYTSSPLDDIREKYALPEAFLLYPAQTWEHKNHLRLLDALAKLRDEHDLVIPLVCTGRRNAFYSKIDAKIIELNLNEQVHFLDFIPESDLRGLYELAIALVFPSLFEGWGLPVTEALSIGLPIVASNVTCLPEQIGTAGIFFDPYSLESITDSLKQVWSDEALKEKLSQAGIEQAKKFTWKNTADKFYVLYQQCLS